MDYNDLIEVPVPAKTVSYSPVSHRNVISEIKERLYENGLSIENEKYNTAKSGNQVIGYFDVTNPAFTDTELGMRIAFRNSYDKSMSLAFCAGNTVWICSNGLISGEINYMRKHTGSVLSEMKDKINGSISQLAMHYEKISTHKDVMKEIMIESTEVAKLCGELYIKHDLIKSTQLSILKEEVKSPSYDYQAPDSLWQFYNGVTHSLKKSHPIDYIKSHINFHNFIEERFNLN